MTTEQTLQGKLALVSGSAKGIGAATCVELASRYAVVASRQSSWPVRSDKQLLARGAQVVVNYPWPSQSVDADEVLKRIKQTQSAADTECLAIEADLSTLDGPQHLVDETVRLTGKKVDILVNNAGVAVMRPLNEIALDQWDKQVNLNARGMMLLTQAVLPHLAQDSRIVNVSSVGARQGYVGSTIYNGTKSMVESFTRCWAL